MKLRRKADGQHAPTSDLSVVKRAGRVAAVMAVFRALVMDRPEGRVVAILDLEPFEAPGAIGCCWHSDSPSWQAFWRRSGRGVASPERQRRADAVSG